MKFGIFFELQLPRPWSPDSEHTLYRNALEQVELVERLGLDSVWVVEHHFLEEYAHLSAPEIFLAACSQRTRHIRLGHGIVQLPSNHPFRVAERIATLDLVSDGRVEFGTGEGATEVELGGFYIKQEDKRAMWMEALEPITWMFVEEPFLGHKGKYFQLPVRNVVPKPVQKPHPPMWLACSRRETIALAAQCGLGALTLAFVSPQQAGQWVAEYYDLLDRECQPVGYTVNATVAVVSPLMCNKSEQRARELAMEHHRFFAYGIGHYAFFGEHQPGKTNLWRNYQTDPRQLSEFNPGEGAPSDSIGTPAQVRDKLREYEEAGLDEIIFLSQAGRLSHEEICASLELFGKEVLPQFKEREPKRIKEKAIRLEPILERAMQRKAKPRIPDWPPTVIRAAGHH
jgi:alkanesulfonate monooxygenase SsuD/methylene tetrahydromethanopterin reductase-like flavin-dependent oxidoreductase (luciferase family)